MENILSLERLMNVARRSIVVMGDVMSVKSAVLKMNDQVSIEKALILPDRRMSIVTLPDRNLLQRAITPRSQRVAWQKWNKSKRNLHPFQFVKAAKVLSRVKDVDDRYFMEILREPLRRGPIEIYKRLYYCPNADDQVLVAYDSLKCKELDLLIPLVFANSVLELLKLVRHNCSLSVFGSKLSGLSVNTSGDLDCRIHFGEPNVMENKDPSAVFRMSKADGHEKHLPALTHFLRSLESAGSQTLSIYGKNPLCQIENEACGFRIDVVGQDLMCDPSLLSNFLVDVCAKQYCPELPVLAVVIKWIFSLNDIKKLTNLHINGFKILILIIHFLQVRHMMPPFSDIISPETERQAPPRVMTLDLFQLLLDFFNYFSEFKAVDSNKRVHICLHKGELEFGNREHGYILYCEEPFHSSLNIFRNVEPRDWRCFCELCQQIAKQLKTSVYSRTNVQRTARTFKFSHSATSWGLQTAMVNSSTEKAINEVRETLTIKQY